MSVEATNVFISGEAVVGGLLTATYDYVGTLPEGSSVYKWYRNGVTIVGANAITYTIQELDMGAYISFSVRPYNSIGERGDPVVSNTILIEDLIASNVTILGRPIVGYKVTGSYELTNSGLEGTSLFQWFSDGNPISGATEIEYQITKNELGSRLEFEVTPKSVYGYEGTPKRSKYVIVARPDVASEKTYQAKVYGYDGTYKRTINPELFMNSPSFSNQINGGQGEYKLQLALPIDNDWFLHGDVLQLTCFDDMNINGRVIYTGSITRIKRNIQSNGEHIELTCLGLFSFMSRIFFRNSLGEFFFVQSEPLSTTMNKIVDCFNDIYTADWISGAGIDTYIGSMSIQMDWNKCSEAIQKVQRANQNWNFYLGPDGVLKYNSVDSISNTHRVKMEKEVESLVIDEQIESSINVLYETHTEKEIVEGEEVETTVQIGPFEHTPGKIKYGQIEKRIQGTGIITNTASATTYATNHLENNKNETRQTTVTINSKYDIESIEPGHYITILNSDYIILQMLITKVQYNKDKVVLSLEKYDSLAKAILDNDI